MKIEINFNDNNGNLETYIFNSEKEIIKFFKNTFIGDFETMQDIENEFDSIVYRTDQEFEILKGNKQIFKIDKKIKGYKKTYKGFSFCTGKPSDKDCISWNYKNYKDSLITAKEYINNL